MYDQANDTNEKYLQIDENINADQRCVTK